MPSRRIVDVHIAPIVIDDLAALQHAVQRASEAFLALVQRPFRLNPIDDVDRDAQHGRLVCPRHAERYLGFCEPLDLAAGAYVLLRRRTPGLAGGQDLAVSRQEGLGALYRRAQFDHGLADDLFDRGAQVISRGLVGHKMPALCIARKDVMGDQVDDLAQAFLTFAHRLLRSLALGNVHRDAQQEIGIALAGQGNLGDLIPARDPVLRLNAHLFYGWTPLRDDPAVAVRKKIRLVHVAPDHLMQLAVRPAHHLLGLEPIELGLCPIGHDIAPGYVLDKDIMRVGIDDGPQKAFVVSQRRLCLLARGDVRLSALDAHLPAVLVAQRGP